ncbi:hypothetical protein HQ560_04925, partial [bacterium]|nr:hypothetical protein [bacterium]
WRADARLRSVRAVFAHPILPLRALLATSSGLLASDDAGRTWRPLPSATAKAIGRVQDVAFDPVATDRFILATDGNGVWASEDGGKTLRCIGAKARGMASDETAAICLYAADRRLATLIVAHADAARGLSVSEDGGATWKVIARGFHVHHIHDGAPGDLWLYFDAAKADAPDARGIHAAHSLGEPWYQLLRDVLPTAFCNPVHRKHALLATADTGLHVLTESGATPLPVTEKGLTAVTSLGVTWNGHADSQLAYAYDPRKQGLIVSADAFAHTTSHAQGLFTGPFVREGAHVRAAADGNVFLAVANGTLYRGVRLGGTLRVSGVAVTPPSVSIARRQYAAAIRHMRTGLRPLADARSAVGPARRLLGHIESVDCALSSRQVGVTARVTGRGGAPTAVTVDTSRLGGPTQAPMLDDGRHGDGKAGDGVYGVTLPISPDALTPDGQDWRRPWPGPMPLTVTAVAKDGSLAAAVGLLNIHEHTEPFSLTDSTRYWRASDADLTGIAYSKGIEQGAPTAPQWTGYTFQTKAGDWRFVAGYQERRFDCTGFHALSFWIKTDRPLDGPVRMILRDFPEYLAPTDTPAVTLGPDKVTPSWRRIVLPLKSLLAPVPQFQTRLLAFFVLSGSDKAPRTFWIDGLTFFPTPESLETDLTRYGKD